MSNKEQIKHKQKLQAQFQLNFNSLNSKILSWIPESSTDSEATPASTEDNAANTFSTELDSFLNLAVIRQGSGLSLGAPDGGSSQGKESTTIGDFINSGKLSSSKDNDRDNRRAGLGKIATSKGKIEKGSIQGNSKALNSLRNKIRDDKRNNTQKNNKSNNNFSRANQFDNSRKSAAQSRTNTNNGDSDSDSDDDDEVLHRKSSAKNNPYSKNPKSKKPF